MFFNYSDYLQYELPEGWCSEYDGKNLLLYHPNGKGALTASFFDVIDMSRTFDENISIMAKKFIDQNEISLHTPLILYGTTDTKMTLYGTGVTPDGWFVKLWIVAKETKVVFATYQSRKKNLEVKQCDSIIDSIIFSL